MSSSKQLQVKVPSQPSLTPVRTGLLQRKCACGGQAGLNGECEECRKKRLTVQRRATEPAGSDVALRTVHDVLRLPGQPLDRETRSVMESRFSHDFSQVRVHTDSQSAESARAVNALAYTVGRDVVFGAGQFAPGTEPGRKLLSHELAHVVQQGGQAFEPGSALRLAAHDDVHERQAEAVSAQSSDGRMSLANSARTANLVQRAVEEAGAQTSTGAKDAEDECAGWFADRESTSKRAAELYVRTELTGDRGVVEKIECDIVLQSGEFACSVHFTDGTTIRVIVRKDAIIVGVFPLQTYYPPPDRPLCWYDYKCPGPNRDLVLTKRKCQSSKPAGSAPPGNSSKGPNP